MGGVTDVDEEFAVVVSCEPDEETGCSFDGRWSAGTCVDAADDGIRIHHMRRVYADECLIHDVISLFENDEVGRPMWVDSVESDSPELPVC